MQIIADKHVQMQINEDGCKGMQMNTYDFSGNNNNSGKCRHNNLD